MTCTNLEVRVQLLRGIGDVHYAAIAEIDGCLHLVVLLRLGEEGIRVLWWGGWLRIQTKSVCSCSKIYLKVEYVL